MAIQLPDFEASRLIQLLVCAVPALEDKRVSEWLNSQEFHSACQSGSGDVLYGRRIGSTQGDYGHFHLEVVKKSFFRGSLPEVETDFDRLLEDDFGPLDNASVEAFIRGRFRLPRKELPKESFITILLGASIKQDDVELRLTGGEMSVVGDSPYSSIAWSADEQRIDVTIEALQEVTLNSSLLSQCAALLHHGLDSLVWTTEVPDGS